MKKPSTLLCILDGFGLNPNPEGNAVYLADTPNFDRLFSEFPSETLITHGEAVGLPPGQMGNSEVGHLNIGAGRVIEQWLLRISNALKGNFLQQSKSYANFLTSSKESRAIHLIGLYSQGGVHSHLEHLHLLIEKLLQDHTAEIVLHLVTDGRDTAPHDALACVQDLEQKTKNWPRVRIATVVGRFYAMDRDRRWERTKQAYDAIALGSGTSANSASAWIQSSYANGITDEFLEPCVIAQTPLRADDAVIFWNFREDRIRQIVKALALEDFSDFPRSTAIPLPQRILCFTEYDHTFKLPYLFSAITIKNHFGELLSALSYSQLRVAETEKYPHVTYFFNGGVEKEYVGETRVLIPSPRDVRTYDLKPEMSAVAVTDVVVDAIEKKSFDAIVVNLANCDMVGHTGVLAAAIKAVETVDTCLGRMITALEKTAGKALIIADHGNAEQMINYQDGTPHTAHTTYPVPVILFGCGKDCTLSSGGSLRNVAPTLLKMMGIPKPVEMTGESLY